MRSLLLAASLMLASYSAHAAVLNVTEWTDFGDFGDSSPTLVGTLDEGTNSIFGYIDGGFDTSDYFSVNLLAGYQIDSGSYGVTNFTTECHTDTLPTGDITTCNYWSFEDSIGQFTYPYLDSDQTISWFGGAPIIAETDMTIWFFSRSLPGAGTLDNPYNYELTINVSRSPDQRTRTRHARTHGFRSGGSWV